MRKSEFGEALHEMPEKGRWWVTAAKQAFRNNHHHLIGQRRDQDQLYLARFWLTPPVEILEERRWTSGDSVCLHYFQSSDDDGALHDHPWDFTTTVLEGAYIENLPPKCWHPRDTIIGSPKYRDWWHDRRHAVGPPYDAVQVRRGVGETVRHLAEDLHAVSRILPGTWTLVRTGAKRRSWGFWPEGELWQGHEEFLARKGNQQ